MTNPTYQKHAEDPKKKKDKKSKERTIFVKGKEIETEKNTEISRKGSTVENVGSALKDIVKGKRKLSPRLEKIIGARKRKQRAPDPEAVRKFEKRMRELKYIEMTKQLNSSTKTKKAARRKKH